MTLRSLFTHAAAAAAGVAAALLAGAGAPNLLAQAQTPPPPPGQRITEVFTQAMEDVGREMRIRLSERDPGNGSPAHRHPCCHTFGYVLEGTYEFKVGDEPMRLLKAGEVFYEPPNAVHAISRNPSALDKVKYLVIQVADPGKPATEPVQ